MMKKRLIIVLAIVLVFSFFSACKKTDSNDRIKQLEEQLKERDEKIVELENQVNVLLALSEKTANEEKPDSVIKVETLINSIGDISFTSGESITKAEQEYRYLQEKEKSLVSNYGDLQRAKDEYYALLKDILIGTWKSDKYKTNSGTYCDDTFVFNEAGGFFSDYNYTKKQKTNSGNMTWTLNEKYIMCECSTVFFGVVPFTFEMQEINGAFCLIRTTVQGEIIKYWKQ